MVAILHLAFWSFVLFLALSFFGISIQAIVTSPVGQANLLYLSGLLSQLWQHILQQWQWMTLWIRPMA